MARQLIHHDAVRYYRHDDFWRDLIERWQASGIGVRKFYEQNGVATSTFHKRRAVLSKCTVTTPMAADVLTPDACFIFVMPDTAMASAAPVVAPVATASVSRKRAIASSSAAVALGDWVSVLIAGPTGAGKSWLASALTQYAFWRGYSAVYQRVPRPLAGRTAHRHGSGAFGQ